MRPEELWSACARSPGPVLRRMWRAAESAAQRITKKLTIEIAKRILMQPPKHTKQYGFVRAEPREQTPPPADAVRGQYAS